MLKLAPSQRNRSRAELRRRAEDRANEDRDEARYDWYGRHARPAQTPPPGDWRTWLVLAGRGFGKTRCGVEWVRHQIETGRCRRMAVVAPTAADARDVLVEGESGLLAICPPWFYPTFEPSKRRLTWPNGAIATTYSADEPERLRGPQHDGGLIDEFAAWRYPAAYDMYVLGNRLRDAFGGGPRTCIATTPRPVPHLLRLLERADPARTPVPSVVVTGGSTFENAANLAEDYLEDIKSSYAGSRLERQEIFAEILRDTPGALWDIDLLESCHLFTDPAGVALARVVVAIDPAATSAEGSSETGIVVAARGTDGRGYVLEDASLRGSPEQWARAAVAAFDVWQADLIVGEVNNGGEMIEAVLRTVRRSIPYKAVRASRGKQTRAEPIAALYRQGKVSHMGVFALLESQMCSWVPGMTSPDRMDACLVAGTPVLTAEGEVPIELIRPGDLVLTRDGWKPVLWAGMTSEAAEVLTVEFSDGSRLTGTGSHPVWTENRGFAPLDTIVWSDTMLSWKHNLTTLSSLTVSPTHGSRPRPTSISAATGGRLAVAARTRSTGRSGNPSTARSPRDVTSTIGTTTRSTMTLTTSSASPGPSMPPPMPESVRIGSGLISPPSGPWLPPGTALRPERISTGNWVGSPGKDARPIPPSPARIAARSARLTSRVRPVSGSVAIAATGPGRTGNIATSGKSPVRSAGPCSGKMPIGPSPRLAPVTVVQRYASGVAPVFNLTVADCPEFFAAGILVHNCVWAFSELLVPGDSGHGPVFLGGARTPLRPGRMGR